MQSRHRKGHRMMWVVLGPLALAALVYALTNRIEMPVMKDVPAAEQMEAGQ